MKWNKDRYKKLIEDYADYLLKNKYKIAMDMVNNKNHDVWIGVTSIDDKIKIRTSMDKTPKFYKE